MLGFTFTLQKVLDLKQKLEDELSLRLAEQERKLAQAQEQLRRLEAQQANQLQELEALQRRSALAMDLIALYHQHLLYLRECQQTQATYIEALRRERDQRREELVQVSKERKALEKLKEKQFQAYQREMLRQEQKQLDEIGGHVFLRNVAEG
ncbi:MAG: flagellar export protein FliJ [Limnochordia bacterium]|jgi:flagellar FliJ protein